MKKYAPGCGGPAWWSGDPELNAMRVADGYYSPLPQRDRDLANMFSGHNQRRASRITDATAQSVYDESEDQ